MQDEATPPLQSRPGPVVLMVRFFLVFGVPILAGVGAYTATDGLLWAVLAALATFVAVIAVVLRMTPADPSSVPGTRAFEALHTANLLVNVIAERRREQAAAQDPGRRAHLEREIAFLTGQLAENRAIVVARDGSPGKGFIGFKPYQGP